MKGKCVFQSMGTMNFLLMDSWLGKLWKELWKPLLWRIIQTTRKAPVCLCCSGTSKISRLAKMSGSCTS